MHIDFVVHYKLHILLHTIPDTQYENTSVQFMHIDYVVHYKARILLHIIPDAHYAEGMRTPGYSRCESIMKYITNHIVCSI